MRAKRRPGLLAEQAPATVMMEACGTAHYWGRGHRAVLLSGNERRREAQCKRSLHGELIGPPSHGLKREVRAAWPAPQTLSLSVAKRARGGWVRGATARRAPRTRRLAHGGV